MAISILQLDNIKRARECYRSSRIDQAFFSFVEAFEANPKAWWLAMEAIRCKRASLADVERGKLIMYCPNYTNNSYQKNLYLKKNHFNFNVVSAGRFAIDEQLVEATFSRRLVFHQHWLKDMYWDAFSMEAGLAAIDRHTGILMALKSFGATICWTLHNIIDHDATPLQEKLNNYAIGKMAEVSDHIFIHTQGSGELLSSHCGTDLSGKFDVVEHPLYDDLLISEQSLPEELEQLKLDGRRILLSVGMIRPYKGVPDLIHAFQQVVRKNRGHGLHLIIAGRLEDPEVVETMNTLEESVRDSITLIARRVPEEELAGLMRLSHVFVTSYKKILTSGSYYLATTFAKPTVAPGKGMFAEIIEDEETGFLYDGSVEGLSTLLHHISTLPEADLARVGENAFQSCRHVTIAEMSTRFFSLLEDGK